MINQTLGHYRVEEKLGAGGMGVVYRATDTKLGRQVAIKVLPEAFAGDPERLARFQREARMLAALNHPNIAAIHGLEESGATHYLVLELVPGETLRGPMPVGEAVRVCAQIAEALEAAHEKGIIHRDLKPANVKITPEGKVKVLDFGLAKAYSGEAGEGPTVSVEPSREGAILGTPAYMSPEQARGKPLDKRADIWAFGCVLYEALAGGKAFPGESFSDCMAAVLTREPEWEALPASTPANVRALLRRCLQKDPARRLRDIGDARLGLEEPLLEAMPAAAEAATRPRLAMLGVACGVLGALAAGLLGWHLWRKAPATPPVARFTINLPPNEVISSQVRPALALSPDGRHVAYVGNRAGRTQLHLRPIDQLESKPIPGTEAGAGPVFSPDSRWLAFFQNFKWKKVALSGGPPVTICDAPQDSSTWATWGPDDTLVFGRSAGFGFWRVSAAGGGTRQPMVMPHSETERAAIYPQFLPGGRALLFTVITHDTDVYDEARVVAHSLETGQRKVLFEGAHRAWYSPSGHIVYIHSGTLLAVPFDLARLAVTGPPAPVVDGVFESLANGNTHVSISANGSLVYAPGGAVSGARKAVWVDRQGAVQPLPMPPRSYLHPRLSPDGRQLAIEVEGPNHDVFTYDLDRGTLTKLTFDGVSHWPLWTPEGKRLTFRSHRTGAMSMWWMPADRSGAEERLTTIGQGQSAASWSPGGRVVAFTQVNPETLADVWVLELDGERKPRPFAQTKFNEGSPRFSPDGRWIAYCSNESGRMEVYAQPYPGPGPKIQISTDGGSDPVWKGKGGELYYRTGEKMMVVDVTTHPVFRAGRPGLLWEKYFAYGRNSSCAAPGPSSSNYDVAPDGQRFLMIQEGEQDAPATQIHVVLNWSEELKRLAPEKKN